MDHKIPYKIYLEEHEMPKEWYNVRADMKKKPAHSKTTALPRDFGAQNLQRDGQAAKAAPPRT